jgi:hypothetical protein
MLILAYGTDIPGVGQRRRRVRLSSARRVVVRSQGAHGVQYGDDGVGNRSGGGAGGRCPDAGAFEQSAGLAAAHCDRCCTSNAIVSASSCPETFTRLAPSCRRREGLQRPPVATAGSVHTS